MLFFLMKQFGLTSGDERVQGFKQAEEPAWMKFEKKKRDGQLAVQESGHSAPQPPPGKKREKQASKAPHLLQQGKGSKKPGQNRAKVAVVANR